MHTNKSPRWHAYILFRILALCLTAPGKWENFTESLFGFLFHDSGYRESFLQVPKAHVSVRILLSEHVWLTQRLICGWLECPNFPGLFTSEATWHYKWNLTPKRWIEAESLKIFPSRPEKGANGLSFFAFEGKIEQQIRISARKRPRGPGLLKQQCPALTSSIESYDKHLKTHQKRRNRPNG